MWRLTEAVNRIHHKKETIIPRIQEVICFATRLLEFRRRAFEAVSSLLCENHLPVILLIQHRLKKKVKSS